MKCSYCGNELRDNSNFCTNCGARVSQAPIVPAPQQQPVQVVVAPTYSDAALGFNVRQTIEKSYIGPAMILIIITLFSIAAATLTAVFYDVVAISQKIYSAEVFMQLIRNVLYFAFSLVSAIASIKALAFPATKNINAFYSQRPFITVRRVLLIIMMAAGTAFIVLAFVLILILASAGTALWDFNIGMSSLLGDKGGAEFGQSVVSSMWGTLLLIFGAYGAGLAAWIVAFTMVSGTYGRVKRYYHMITKAYTDYKYDIRVKPPFIRCFVIGGLLIIVGIALLLFCYDYDLRVKVLTLVFTDNAWMHATGPVLYSLVFQSAALMLMGVHLILNGVIIHKYKVRLHDAFTNYENARVTYPGSM